MEACISGVPAAIMMKLGVLQNENDVPMSSGIGTVWSNQLQKVQLLKFRSENGESFNTLTLLGCFTVRVPKWILGTRSRITKVQEETVK